MAVGDQVGPYRLDAEVGRGAMGVVYRATHVESGRGVALKVMLDAASDRSFRDRFIRESRIASSIDHPHVIPVFETGEHDGRLFIAMSFVEGRDLGRILADSPGGLAAERAVRFVSQAASALDVAHGRGLVHRDVKPANILVSVHREHTYLSDFGLTRQVDGTRLTSPGEFVGTVAYCSPEQIKGDPIGPATDVYALGCVLFEALTGRLPFERDSEVALMWAQVHEPPPDLGTIAPHVPAGLGPVLERALAKAPADRYASAGAFARAANDALTPAPAVDPSRRDVPARAAPKAVPVGEQPLPNAPPPVAEQPVPAAPAAVAQEPAPADPARPDDARGDWLGVLLPRVLGATAIVLSLIIAAGFLLFAVGERDRAGTSTHLASYERISPTSAGEATREARNGGVREAIDDANDILLKPFAAIAGDSGRWAARGVPAALGLLLYGLLLANLARVGWRRRR